MARRRWQDNIKIYLREIGCKGVRIGMVEACVQWHTFVNMVINIQALQERGRKDASRPALGPTQAPI
jgi:hypothetical protein